MLGANEWRGGRGRVGMRGNVDPLSFTIVRFVVVLIDCHWGAWHRGRLTIIFTTVWNMYSL